MSKILEIYRQWHSRKQLDIFTSPYRFIILVAGRRYGKTRGSVNKLMEESLRAPHDIPVAWISPTYKQSKIAFRYFKKLFGKTRLFLRPPNESNLEIITLGGGMIQFRSAERAEHIEGEGYKFIVVEESWDVLSDPDVWLRILRPTLMDVQGKALFIGRADFENTFWHSLYLKGLTNNPNWKTYHATSYDNPLIIQDEIDSYKEEEGMTDDIFNQQIMAEFLPESGKPFAHVKQCAIGDYESYKSSYRPYYQGIDLAKHADFTVSMVGYRNKIINIDRWQHLSWPMTEDKLMNINKKYGKTKMIIDSTGVGDPVYDHLLEKGANVEPYRFTEDTRRKLLENLQLMMEKRQIIFPPHKELCQELNSMGWKISAKGKVRIDAPAGRHDDCVMSLALCVWGMKYAKAIDIEKDIDTFGKRGEVDNLYDDMIYDGDNIHENYSL
jgi:hypothetical protein